MSFWLEYIDGGGMRHTIQYDGVGELWIGRRLGCSIHSFDEHLSREHCWIEFDPDKDVCVLQDNASTDGTYVNGSPIVTHVLEHGDVIECASMLITFWSRPRGAIDTVELDHMSTRLDEALARAQRLQAERDAMVEARRSGEHELQAELDAVRHARMNTESDLRVQLESTTEERDEMRAAIERYRVREAKLNAQLDWLENRVRELEDTPDSSEDQLEPMRAEVSELRGRAERAEEEANRFSDELDDTRETLAKVRKQLDQITQKLASQRSEAEDAASKRDELWAELRDARQTIEDLRGVVDNQENMITTLREAARERETLIQKLRSD